MQLSVHDLQFILLRTPKKVLVEMKLRAGKMFLAGGFIRACIANEEAADIDLFAPSKEEALTIARALAQNESDPSKDGKIHSTDNAYTIKTFGIPLQVIHRWTFETPQRCVESFDFTVAKAAIWWDLEADRWASLCADDFYQDLASRRLIYTSPVRNEDPGGSMLRVLKFYQKGYRIPLSSLGAVMARMMVAITDERMETQSRISEGKSTREEMMAIILTGMLREVDPAIDPRHLAHIPDFPKQTD